MDLSSLYWYVLVLNSWFVCVCVSCVKVTSLTIKLLETNLCLLIFVAFICKANRTLGRKRDNHQHFFFLLKIQSEQKQKKIIKETSSSLTTSLSFKHVDNFLYALFFFYHFFLLLILFKQIHTYIRTHKKITNQQPTML